MSDLPAELKRHREEKGLSYQRLTALCGISDSTISKIEKGESPNLRWDTVCCLTKALDFTQKEFLQLAGFDSSGQVDTQSVLHGLSDLTEDEFDKVQEFIDFLHFCRRQRHEGRTD